MPPKFALTPKEAQHAAGCGKTTLFLAMRRGDLRRRKVGRKTLILQEDLLAWLRGRPSENSTPAT